MIFAETTELPFPDDLVIDGQPIQLVPGDSGDLLGEKSQNLDAVQPSEYSPASYPQYAEKTLDFRWMQYGMGTRRQRTGFPSTYDHDINVDGSIGCCFGRGPHFHLQNGVAGQPMIDGVVGLHDGVEKEFGGFGHVVAVRNGDATTEWVTIKDFGARIVSQMTRFKSQGVAAIDAVYVTTDDGEFWQFDGTIWSQVIFTVAPAGPLHDFLPTGVEVINDEMFLAGDGVVFSVTANPLVTTSANYSGPVFVGDPGVRINWLRALGGQLFVFTEAGVFSVSGETGSFVVTDLMPEFKNTRSVTNGRQAHSWNDALWFPWGDTLWKVTLEGDGNVATFATVGLGVLMENESEVRGTPAGFCGHHNWFGYFVVVNGADSYLCKWGSWLNPTEQDPARYKFIEVPHGALKKWTGKTVSRIWTSAVAGPSTNQRLYAGFVDGTVEYCLLPKGSPNPFTVGSGCEFTLDTAIRYVPEVDADWPFEMKSWRAITIFALDMVLGDVIRIFYRDPNNDTWTALPEVFTRPTQRVTFPPRFGSQVLCQYVDLTGPNILTTAVLEGWGLHYSVVPQVILEYTGAADARICRVRRDGSVDERDPDIIRRIVLAAVETVGALPCLMPDGTTRDLNFFRYSESLDRKWQRIGREWVVPFKAIEFETRTIFGTHRRLEAYTHGQLEGFGSHRALENL